MSSRALRKLQREQEEQKQLQELGEQAQDDSSAEEEAPTSKASNAFDMLNANEEGEPESGNDEEKEDDVRENKSQEDLMQRPTAKSKPKKPKKKKNKKKGKENETNETNVKGAAGGEPQLDEIDLALQSLATKADGTPEESVGRGQSLVHELDLNLQRLLAVESKHLNALNEMKRLFGNAVLANEDAVPATPRRRARGTQQLDLGGALGAQHSPVSRGQGLAGLALRRNFLIQGKEEWPKAAGGGLGMELVARLDDGTTEFRFVHNTMYQDVQRQFESCVHTMDPQQMVSMLIYNPYHVSTLLQVSEIAKQQGDHSVSGDLLERALFNFGRSVHTSFTHALSEGKARLNFDRPENREFWLASWRYMNNLGQRGTWRTAYEWAKLILSLDPELDPYCITKVIDQLALRGGQTVHLLELDKSWSLYYPGKDYTAFWLGHPNMAISSALAQYRLKRPSECRATLQKSIEAYPWVFARLFQELNLDHVPKSIWGKTPRNAAEELASETYVHNAKDLWNTPEATSLLVEVAESATPPRSIPANVYPITLSDARYAVLSGVTAAISCIPREFTNRSTSASDPFSPPEDLPSYDPSVPRNPDVYHNTEHTSVDGESSDNEGPRPLQRQTRGPVTPPNNGDATPATDITSLQGFFSRFLPWLHRAAAADNSGSDEDTSTPGPNETLEADLAAPIQDLIEAGVTQDEITAQTNRLREEINQVMDNSDPDRGPDSPPSNSRRRVPGRSARTRAANPAETDAIIQRVTDAIDAALDREVQREVEAVIDAAVADRTPSSSSSSSGSAQPGQQHQTQQTPPSQSHPEPAPYDDAANQRWLAGRGMLHLKDYTTKHSVDPAQWPADGEGEELLREYATRIRQLQQQTSRRFILDYALRQGAGNAVGELVEREVEALGERKVDGHR